MLRGFLGEGGVSGVLLALCGLTVVLLRVGVGWVPVRMGPDLEGVVPVWVEAREMVCSGSRSDWQSTWGIDEGL